MARKSKKKNPVRFRPSSSRRNDYYKSLEQRPVSPTKEGSEPASSNGTDQLAHIDYSNVPKPDKTKVVKPINWERILAIVGGIILVVGFIATAVYKYTVVEQDISAIKTDIRDLKQNTTSGINRVEGELRKEVRHLGDRIDNYLSNEKASRTDSR